ncbi:Presenilin-domain-containing protein [Cokeromyces recurvatus]|uniref:Presenilin-domain-containing protein n=1 Tax=Cokeromyces recurvatus TaxID=90255 RepID=UPI00221FDDC2|nr:Presenilin-domain-containing protein [Cokeromyces recurvatus]KAI7899719.1 Presenilin-domain-containing protein [Cokeromyces recurvatus]
MPAWDAEEEDNISQSLQPLLQENQQNIVESNNEQNRHKETIQFFVKQLTLLFYPLIITFTLTCWIETTLAIDDLQFSNPLMVYDEIPTDNIGIRLGGSILNAIAIVVGIAAMTFLFVLCFKYRLYQFLFFWLGFSVLSILGVTTTTLWIEMMDVYDLPLDYMTMVFCAWNISVVGVIAIFWKSPLWVQQAYLIIVSTATSISMLRMPPWTTWTVLIAVSLYDLFAVLCPAGPLNLLISIAEERQEEIPALIYSAGMASFDNSETSAIDGYRTQETSTNTNIWTWIFNKSSKKGYHVVQNSEEGAFVNELTDISSITRVQEESIRNDNIEVECEQEDEEDELKAIKLGLGDFIFYSVLVGKASRTNAITLCLCIIAILTGLSLTILILTLKKKALPALPISILFGSITYAIAYYMTSPMINSLSLQSISL